MPQAGISMEPETKLGQNLVASESIPRQKTRKSHINAPDSPAPQSVIWINFGASAFTLSWFAVCFYILWVQGQWFELAAQSPDQIMLYFATLLAPVALIWLLALYLRANILTKENTRTLQQGFEAILAPQETAQSQIDTIRQSLDRQISELREAGTTAEKQLGLLENSHRKYIAQLAALAEQTAERAEQAKRVIEAKESDLADLSDRLIERARLVEKSVDQATHNFFSAADQAMIRAGSTSEMFDERVHELQAASEKAGAVTASLGVDLHAYIETLQEATAAAEVESGNIGKSFQSHAETAEGSSRILLDRSRKIAKSLAHQSAEFERIAEKIESDSGQIHEKLTAGGMAIETAFDHADQRANAACEKLQNWMQELRREAETLSENIEDRSKASRELISDQSGEMLTAIEDHISLAVSRIEDARQIYDAYAQEMTQAAENAGDAIEVRSQIFEAMADQLANTSKRVETALLEKSKALSVQADHVSEQAIKSGKILDLEAQKWNVTEEEIADKIKGMKSGLAQYHTMFSALIRNLTQDLGKTHQTAKSGAEELAEMSQDLTTQLTRGADILLTSVNELGQTGQRSGEQLKALEGEMRQRASEISRVTGNLHGQLKALSEHGEHTSRQLEKSREATTRQASEIQTITRKSQHHMNTMSTIFARQALELRGAAEQTSDITTVAVERLGDQAKNLLLTAEQVKDKAGSLLKEESDKSREIFFRNSSYMVESLNSLSVDLNRIFEKELPEETWRKYIKGENGAFSRRFKRLASSRNRRRILRHYETNSEFRKNVDQYRQQFHTLVKDASSADPTGALGVSLMSSDCGKIYLLLEQSL